ncbi:MAG: hypothetical protein GXZ08_03240 [Tissierellia bacterium]|nr:hypothetical protein [Tissierellia bacterium]
MINIRNILKLIIPLALILYIVFKFSPNLISSNIPTKLPKQSEYLDKIDTKGFLIMNERIYTSQGEGVLELNASEGDRVPKDFEVVNLNLMNDDTDTKDELFRVQSAIEYKNKSLNPDAEEHTTTDAEKNIIYSIQENIQSGNMNDLFTSIDNLELNTRKNINISDIGELINLSIPELESRRDKLSKEVSINNIPYKAEYAGIVSYKIDNFEEVLSVENLDNINYETLKEIKLDELEKVTNHVGQGDKIYKLIDNYEYYMAAMVEDFRDITDYKEGDTIELVADVSVDLKGQVIKKSIQGENAVLIIKLNEKLHDLNYNRIHDISIIKSKSYIYVIPSSSIVILENQEGVYIKELNGIVRFRPINIINQNEFETYVDMGDNKGYINIEGKADPMKTITVFDDVITNPQNVEDGQIIK